MNKTLHFIFSLTLILTVLSCNDPEEKKTGLQEQAKDTIAQLPELAKQQSYYIKTFEVKDEAGNSLGWGYDIYIDSVRTIHQPTIPAVAGIHYFKTEKDAGSVGEFATAKMSSTGSFPTLSIEELDSLGVIKNSQ
jgi:hypothetical protein